MELSPELIRIFLLGLLICHKTIKSDTLDHSILLLFADIKLARIIADIICDKICVVGHTFPLPDTIIYPARGENSTVEVI